MKQTWPELKAQAHRSPCSVSPRRKDEQTHDSLVCDTGMGLLVLPFCSASKPLCLLSPGGNAKHLQIPLGYNSQQIHRCDYTGPLFVGFGESHPHPHHLVQRLLSPHCSRKGNEANTTLRSIIPASSTLARLVFLLD